MERRARERLTRAILLPLVLSAVVILGTFTVRTSLQVESLRQQSIAAVTLELAREKADRLDQRLIDEDNVVASVADPTHLGALEERWLPTARRETPTVRAIVVLDEARNVLAFASRAGGAFSEEEAFRRLLIHRMLADMELVREPVSELRHLHRQYRGQVYLVSYWQRAHQGRNILVIAWHDIARIVRDLFGSVFSERSDVRVSVVDEEGRVVFGSPLRTGYFTVSVRFPTTLYGWRLQVLPQGSEALTDRVNRRLRELILVGASGAILVLGGAILLFVTERERRLSAMKSDLVANVSHELKTPLSLIRMFAEMLESGTARSEEKKKEYLRIILTESERLSALIENVLDFARLERKDNPLAFAERRLDELVKDVVETVRSRAQREGVSVLFEADPGLPEVRVDPAAVELAAGNLVDNAIKYGAGSGPLEVAVRRRGGTLVVSVKDHGPGIPVSDHARIFERFVRLRSEERGKVRGAGIGLALVKQVAEAHGGKAWVESRVGEGSTFSFSIPLAPRS